MPDYRNKARDSGTGKYVTWVSAGSPDPTFASAPAPSGSYSDYVVLEVIGSGGSTPVVPDDPGVVDSGLYDWWVSDLGVSQSGVNLTSWTGQLNSKVISPSGTVTVDDGSGGEFGGLQFISKATGSLAHTLSPTFGTTTRPYIAIYAILPPDTNDSIGAVAGYDEAFQLNRNLDNALHLERLRSDGSTIDADTLPWGPAFQRVGLWEMGYLGRMFIVFFNGIMVARRRSIDEATAWAAAIDEFVLGGPNIASGLGDNESPLYLGGVIAKSSWPTQDARDGFLRYFHNHFSTAVPSLADTPAVLDSNISEYLVGHQENIVGEWETSTSRIHCDAWRGSYRGFSMDGRRAVGTNEGLAVASPGALLGNFAFQTGNPDNTATLSLGIDFNQSDANPSHPTTYAVSSDLYCAVYGLMVPSTISGNRSIIGLRGGFMLTRDGNTTVGMSFAATGPTYHNPTVAMVTAWQTKWGLWEWVYDNSTGDMLLYWNRSLILTNTLTPATNNVGSIDGFRCQAGSNLNVNGEMLIAGAVFKEGIPVDADRDGFLEYYERAFYKLAPSRYVQSMAVF